MSYAKPSRPKGANELTPVSHSVTLGISKMRSTAMFGSSLARSETRLPLPVSDRKRNKKVGNKLMVMKMTPAAKMTADQRFKVIEDRLQIIVEYLHVVGQSLGLKEKMEEILKRASLRSGE